MTHPPAVVIIARHGPRLDAADQNWHLSTPTPYDPPLTYGGWNQCRALGVRIASLLHTREQTSNEPAGDLLQPDGIKSHDFGYSAEDGGRRSKRRKKHKVIIHTSPFLRCVQTSVAIAAGMAQFSPPAAPSTAGNVSKPAGSGKGRSPNQLHSRSPRLSESDFGTSPILLSVPEPRQDLAHDIARRALHDQKTPKKAKLRVDAFLGEWLNPEYYEHITPPPPSAMMVATAKAELMQNDAIDVFTPTMSSKSSHSSLWGGGSLVARPGSSDSALDDWGHVQDALPPSPMRDRANSHSSVASNDSGSSRRSHLRWSQGHHSNVPRPEIALYTPPTPTYAVSTAEQIPRGYMAHARNACTNVDYHWDSSRAPQDWGDGGEYGEEWSALHRRFRRGLTQMVQWYSQHNADDRGEDALGFDQAERHNTEDESDDQEELVVILVTHAAGCNALIGALTGQPVLLDVGMGSLTMAVRKEGGRFETSSESTSNDDGFRSRNGPLDNIALASMYEMKIVSSSEHLRSGADPTRLVAATSVPRSNGALPQHTSRRGESAGPGAATGAHWSAADDRSGRGSTSAALGSILRPSLVSTNSGPSRLSVQSLPLPKDSLSPNTSGASTPSSWTGGLWTPPAARTPLLNAQVAKEGRREMFPMLNESSNGGRTSPGRDLALDFSNSPPVSRPTSSGPGVKNAPEITGLDGAIQANLEKEKKVRWDNGDAAPDVKIGDNAPQNLRRGSSQRGLWGVASRGDRPRRNFGDLPKRRWTVDEEK